MKVLYIITKSESGGAQTHITQLSEHMKALGHTVAVMAFPGGPLQSKMEERGIAFFPNRFLSNTFNVFDGWGAMREIRRVVSSFSPDLVSLHSSAAGFWGRLAIRGRVPTVFTAHGWGFTDGTSPARKWIAIIAEKLVSRFCSHIVCVSSNDRALALRYGIAAPERLRVIHNGVELGPDVLPGNAFHAPEKEIVFVGRLAAPKQPDLVLRAFHRLSESLRNRTTLTFIGDGPMRSELAGWVSRAGLESRIRFLGDISRSAIFTYLSNPDTAKVFVLSSRYEGLPRSILEAMSCGLPIIASDVGGVREMVDAENGAVVPRYDRDALVAALTAILSDASRMESMGHVSRHKVEQGFTLPLMFEQTRAVYDRALADRL